MRVGIVGAGIFGLAAALERNRRGHRVRGPIPCPDASSTDVSKVIRRTSYLETRGKAGSAFLNGGFSYIEMEVEAKKWSERRDSNPRQPRWQRGALPTELLSLENRSIWEEKI